MLEDIFDTLAIPFELVDVYKAVTSVWEALPGVIKITMTCCFGVACLFAILKMLF